MAAFQSYREELDARYDRHERLVKLSRDCTISSKRIIFLLHRIGGDGPDTKSAVLSEAEGRLKDVMEIFQRIAAELEGQDPGRHHSAYLPGVQEFVEALAYFVFLKTGELIKLEEAQEYLTFSKMKTLDLSSEAEKGDVSKEMNEARVTSDSDTIKVPLDPVDFVLGIADLTGELMRLSINAVGSGNTDLPFDLLPFVRAVYCGFHHLRPISKEIPKKLSVLRASLMKIEQTCYTLEIRGSEIPKHMLVHVLNTGTQSEAARDSEAYDYDS